VALVALGAGVSYFDMKERLERDEISLEEHDVLMNMGASKVPEFVTGYLKKEISAMQLETTLSDVDNIVPDWVRRRADG